MSDLLTVSVCTVITLKYAPFNEFTCEHVLVQYLLHFAVLRLCAFTLLTWP